MNKKKLLVLCPVLPNPMDIVRIQSSLAFLTQYYELTYNDPLEVVEQDPKIFFKIHQDKLLSIINNYDAVLGFSLGGILVQNIYAKVTDLEQKIVLLSTPSFINDKLEVNLKNIIDLIGQGTDKAKVNSAFDLFYNLVNYASTNSSGITTQPNKQNFDMNASFRLAMGLSYVLATDATKVLQESSINYLNILGENSKLVNKNNVLCGKNGIVKTIPNSGMRVLEHNPELTQNLIKNYLLNI